MGLIIFLAMLSVPIIEIWLFIEVGGWIGVGPTIGIVIVTAIAGTALLRHQGLGVIRRVQDSLERNELPITEVFDGLCLLVAGALLLTPGFATDCVGFLLFLPPFRRALAAWIGRYLVTSGRVHVMHGGPGSGGRGPGGRGPGDGPRRGPGGPGGGPVIDGEFEEVDEEPGGGNAAPDDNQDDEDERRRLNRPR